MMLIANSCLSILSVGCMLLWFSLFTLRNDLYQISHPDSLCIFRGYMIDSIAAPVHYSYFLQALYRYTIVVHPTRLIFKSVKYSIIFNYL